MTYTLYNDETIQWSIFCLNSFTSWSTQIKTTFCELSWPWKVMLRSSPETCRFSIVLCSPRSTPKCPPLIYTMWTYRLQPIRCCNINCTTAWYAYYGISCNRLSYWTSKDNCWWEWWMNHLYSNLEYHRKQLVYYIYPTYQSTSFRTLPGALYSWLSLLDDRMSNCFSPQAVVC